MSNYEEVVYLVLQKVRNGLYSKGNKTVRQLSKIFRQMDSFDGNNKVDRDEFVIGLKEIGLNLSKGESDLLLVYLDRNRDGSIDIKEFLDGIRGQLNPERKYLVDYTFAKLDVNNQGVLDTNYLKAVFDCSLNPKVQQGQKTTDEIYLEFLSNFGYAKVGGFITRDEWEDYYTAVSSTILKDENFCTLMKKTWRLE